MEFSSLSISRFCSCEYLGVVFQIKTELFILLNHLNQLKKPDPLTLTCMIQQILPSQNSAFSNTFHKLPHLLLCAQWKQVQILLMPSTLSKEMTLPACISLSVSD